MDWIVNKLQVLARKPLANLILESNSVLYMTQWFKGIYWNVVTNSLSHDIDFFSETTHILCMQLSVTSCQLTSQFANSATAKIRYPLSPHQCCSNYLLVRRSNNPSHKGKVSYDSAFFKTWQILCP